MKYLIRQILFKRIKFFSFLIHFILICYSLLTLFFGFHTRINANFLVKNLTGSGIVYGNIDTVSQGNVVPIKKISRNQYLFNIITHKVSEGESLSIIASKYSVSEDTIKWANLDIINQYTGHVTVDSAINIPEIDGVLYEVKRGDTLEDILTKTQGDRFRVIEINQLAYNNFQISEGQKLFIPGGKLPPPPPLLPVQNINRKPTNVGVQILTDSDKNLLNSLKFSNPLSNPDCNGYVISRGFFPGHYGVDLGKYGGCPVRAVADGVVAYAGLGYYGEGFFVRIDHGNDIHSVYFHAETLWVSTGQFVKMGQEIMYMGCTGFCTGTHLHFGIRYQGNHIDPFSYVPY